MTQREGSDTSGFDRTQAARERGWRRVKLAPAERCVDVTPCCGPDGDLVMVNTFIDRGALFLTVAEAEQLSEAIHNAKVTTELGE